VPTIRTFLVRPSIPAPLKPLEELARNLWWCWNHGAIDLFMRLDRDLWDQCDHGPLKMLARASQAQLEVAAQDEGFLSQLEGVHKSFRAYMDGAATSWFARHAQAGAPAAGAKLPAEAWPQSRIAYFSAEFGLTESVPVYSGGLGVLAGDHIKSASDLGLPLVGVSLLYREAFHQYLNADGWQQDIHPETDLATLPVTLLRDAKGNPIKVRCELPGRPLWVQSWRLDVGRVPLILLDVDLPENSAEDRKIDDRLYGGDIEMRLQQEILLGIGGMRVLHALGLAPAVCHMNEGHSAFLALERTRMLQREMGLNFREAAELSAAGNVFTTHTPVPAGNDRFQPDLMERYFEPFWRELGLTRQEFLALGREDATSDSESFCMTVLALKLAARSNAVAKLHATVSRRMWRRVYPGAPDHEVPVAAITNGVHQRSYLSSDMRRLFDRYLGPRWITDPDEPATWERVMRIPAEELWRTHERRRDETVAFARARLRSQLERRGGARRDIDAAAEVLDPRALTFGFARRFATYKRASMVLRDPARLARLVGNPQRPVQFIFAGKAHQKDEPGKEIIRKLVHLAAQPEFRNRIVFVEDYDINVARMLVQGVDVWMNTPARPYEASGTSGMKAVVNGAIHASILDGWWAEAYEPDLGWAVGNGEEYADRDVGDRIESEALYHLLETEIVPLFYDRGKDGLPRGWIDMMKESIRKLAPVFNTHRMVREYFERSYGPSGKQMHRLAAERGARARALAAYRARVAAEWPRVTVRRVEPASRDVLVGQPLHVTAAVSLGGLSPADVSVELFHGPVDVHGNMVDGVAAPMKSVGRGPDEAFVFDGEIASSASGWQGFGVRVLPRHEDLASPFGTVPVCWG